MAGEAYLVDGPPGQTLSFVVPGTPPMSVLSVLAEIDTGGAGDTTATLEIADRSGDVLDALPQGQAIPGGGQGRATWALRLAEDGGGTPATPLETTDGVHTVNPTHELLFDPPASVTDLGGGVARIDIAPVTPALIYAQAIIPGGPWPALEFPLTFAPGLSHGVTVTPTSWTIQTAGVYQISMAMSMSSGGPVPADSTMGGYIDVSGAVVGSSGWQLPVAIGALNTWAIGPTLVEQRTLAVGNVVRFGVGHIGGANRNLGMDMALVRLGA